MAQDDARGYLRESRVVGGIDRVGAVRGPVMGEGSVEVELSLINKLQDCVSKDRLGERSGGEAGVVSDGGAIGWSVGVDGTEAPEPFRAAVLDEGDGEAGDIAGEGGHGGFGVGLLRADESCEEDDGGDGSAKHAFSRTGCGFQAAKLWTAEPTW